MITSQTFYRAECDANGCNRTFPGEEDASHYPMDLLVDGMAEGRGKYDEHWTKTAEGKTYCPKHTPGNTDCITCGCRGMVKTNPEGKTFLELGWVDCDRCDGRGYLVNNSGTVPDEPKNSVTAPTETEKP